MSNQKQSNPLINKEFPNSPTLRHWELPSTQKDVVQNNAVVDCGWGRLIFAQTFADPHKLVGLLREEKEDTRDIALYVRDPHVLTALAPQEVFLDPSHTYRLDLSAMTHARRPEGIQIRRINILNEAKAARDIYRQHHMVPAKPEFMHQHCDAKHLIYLIAVCEVSGEVVGVVTGIDHKRAFNDPENGSSMWALAVDARSPIPGIGEALVLAMAHHFKRAGRAFLDLSVMHNNGNAIALYEKLGFQRVPVFALKRKNQFNEPLYIADPPEAQLNPYATILIKEARRRGIGVTVLDAENGYFKLSFARRSIVCRESLSELTSAIAMSRCDDKAVTRRVVQQQGICVPEQVLVDEAKQAEHFLAEHGSVVVKPARGEQGAGISIDIRDMDELAAAITRAQKICERVVLERYVSGEDLRIIVIDFKVVAAAIRRPAEINGTGKHTVKQLIEKQSRRRAAATGGESRIPIDEETERCVREAGYAMDKVLPAGTLLRVRKTANLHTGGTIHDVTDQLHPVLRDAAEQAASAINIPVTGLDFLVPRVDGSDYMMIEANERPGLANHEPQPTAERFIDLLFPQTAALDESR